MSKVHSESESESDLLQRIKQLEKLVKLITIEIESMQRVDNTGFKHQNDGGGFDCVWRLWTS